MNSDQTNQSHTEAFGRFILEMLQIAAIAVAIILPVRYFLVQPFIVKGASMEPNYYENQYLIIDELTYRFRDPERGETVVFHPPGNESQYYIKRVIGLPGETVEVRDGHIVIYNADYPNGTTLDETYLVEETDGAQRVTLSRQEYFLMGDNRDASLDSRAIGPIPFKNITGKVWFRGLPLGEAGAIETPAYNM